MVAIPWTKEEEAYIKENFPAMSDGEIAKALNRTIYAVKSRRWILGLIISPLKDTKCWDCQRAAGKNMCSWARSFKPVKGWEAVPTRISDYETSFYVKKCPLFIPDEERKKK